MTEAPKGSQPFKSIAAAVETISTEKRMLTAIDESGITHPMKWATGYLDEKLGKLKEGYYREFTCEVQGEDLRITSVKYLESPDWVRARFKGKGGGQGFSPRKPRVTIAATINLQNYENIKVEVEGSSAEESTKILIDTLNGFAIRPEYATTRDMIQGYLARVLNVKKGGA